MTFMTSIPFSASHARRIYRPGICFAAALAAALCLASPAHSQSPASFFDKASEVIALPGIGWALQEKSAARVIDRQGAELAKVALRGKHLDARVALGQALVVGVDSDTQRIAVLRVDVAGGTKPVLKWLSAPAFSVETLCLYRDAQKLEHVIVVGKDGQTEQWLLQAPEDQRLYRRLALPPHVRHCRVDDASGTLFVSEEHLGLWAFDLQGEGIPRREPVALRKPFGPLVEGAGAVQPVAGGVAVLDQPGGALHVFGWNAQQRRWLPSAPPSTATGNAAKRANELALGEPGSTHLLVRNATDKVWQSRRIAAPRVAAVPEALPVILPRAQTDPVARLGDAADDPAIWIHPADVSKSRVLGTNKKQGLLVYDLAGREQQLLEVGRLNNVDLRQQVMLDGRRFDLAVATQRDDLSLVVFGIDSDGKVAERARIPTGLKDIYGVCLYQPKSGGLEVFVNDKDGTFLQVRVELAGDKWGGSVVRRFKVASQPEGCVADDREDRLFLGEEKRGLWVTSARADQPADLKMVLPVGKVLTADVEGMAIHYGARHSYLVVSSQGSNSYVVLDAKPPFAVRGAFRIGINVALGIDGASETDGLDVTSVNLGPGYPAGMLVVQDGYKRLPDGPQNFKYVSWEDVATALRLP